MNDERALGVAVRDEQALDVETLKALAEKATPGPWFVSEASAKGYLPHYGVSSRQPGYHDIAYAHCSWDGFGNGTRRDDAEFIAACRSAVPALIAALEEAQRQRDQALQALNAVVAPAVILADERATVGWPHGRGLSLVTPDVIEGWAESLNRTLDQRDQARDKIAEVIRIATSQTVVRMGGPRERRYAAIIQAIVRVLSPDTEGTTTMSEQAHGFYEDDEPIEQVLAAFDNGTPATTSAPGATIIARLSVSDAETQQ